MSAKIQPQREISTADAPDPISLFSQGIVYNGIAYCSGSVGLDPETNTMVSGGVEEHTVNYHASLYPHTHINRLMPQVQILKNLAAVLENGGSSLEKVLKVNVFLTSMDDFDAMNRGYKQFFNVPFPVRTCVCVKALPLNSKVEIECTGYI